MRILFVAPVSFNNITFFISHYVTGLANAATSLGHDVKLLQTSESYFISQKLIFLQKCFNSLRKYARFLFDLPHDLILNRQLLNTVDSFKPDIVFIHLIDSYYTHLAVKIIRKSGFCVVTWLGIHPDNASKGIKKILKESNFTLIYDPSYIDYYKSNLGIHNTRIVPLGCDSSFYESVSPNDLFIKNNYTDICFVGMFNKHRETYLKELVDFKLGIWSWNIDNYKTDLKRYHRGVAYGEDLVKVIKSSKISINIHNNLEVSGGNFRLFEIPACGIMQMVDEKKNIAEYFEPDKEIVTFKDTQELKDKVKFYLAHTSEREKIARAGFERVKRDHSLIDRMKRIISICSESHFSQIS